jgi:dynein heavy chain
MTDNVKIMFEVEDLRNASPATVSRAGIIYVSASDLDWGPVVEAWLLKRPDSQVTLLRECFEKHIGANTQTDIGFLFTQIRRQCKEVLTSSRVGAVEASLSLLTSLLSEADLSESPADLGSELERLFLFSITWSVGGLLNPEDREKFDQMLRTTSAENMPPQQADNRETLTIYDYCVNMETMEWELWSVPAWKYPNKKSSDELDYSNVIVPTVDSTSAMYLLAHMHKQKKPLLMVGEQGTAKTTTALLFFETFPEDMLLKKVNFSNATTPGMFQGTVEGELDKRGGKNFGPPSGKKNDSVSG